MGPAPVPSTNVPTAVQGPGHGSPPAGEAPGQQARGDEPPGRYDHGGEPAEPPHADLHVRPPERLPLRMLAAYAPAGAPVGDRPCWPGRRVRCGPGSLAEEVGAGHRGLLLSR